MLGAEPENVLSGFVAGLAHPVEKVFYLSSWKKFLHRSE